MGIEEFIKTTNKQYGDNALIRLCDRQELPRIDPIPTGSFGLNRILGIGGLPKGRIVEVYGQESSLKTTLCLTVIANAQRGYRHPVTGLEFPPGEAAYIDAEHSLDLNWARRLGVDIGRLVLNQPGSGEEALDIAESMIRSELFSCIVVDSVAALVPKAELEGDMGEGSIGMQARLMSQAMRKLTGIVSKSNACLIFINQTRNKVGVIYGSPEVTSGGQALKFYASVRLEVRRRGQIKDGEAVAGHRILVKTVKNKCAPPFREHEFDFLYESGINVEREVLDIGVELGIIERAGASYRYAGKQLGSGRDSAVESLVQDSDLFQRITAQIWKMEAGSEP